MSLRAKTRSKRVGIMASLAMLLSVFGFASSASAEVPADYSLTTRFVYGCGTVYDGTGLRVYYDSSGVERDFKLEISVAYEAGTEQTVLEHSNGNTTSYVGLWGALPGTLESLKGEVTVAAYVDGGTADTSDEPLYERYPSADLSATYDCTPAPPPDADGDGVPDSLDKCSGTPKGATDVDANGCSWAQRDDDGDGVLNGVDKCSGTTKGAAVDADGCSAAQRDSDKDGVFDDKDQCPGTPVGEVVNANGCSASQIDTDQDGVFDSVDQCPTQSGPAGNGGCPVTNPDVTYLSSGKLGKACQTAKGCKTTVVVNHLGGQTAPVLTAELSSGALLQVKPRRENVNTSVYTISFPKGVSILRVSAILPYGAQLH